MGGGETPVPGPREGADPGTGGPPEIEPPQEQQEQENSGPVLEHLAGKVISNIGNLTIKAKNVTLGSSYGGMHATDGEDSEDAGEDDAARDLRLVPLGQQLQEARRVFYAPDWYWGARRKLTGRLVFLQGRPGVGKYTAALNLLAELHLKDVLLLESDQELTEFSWIEDGCGYLLEKLVRERAAALREEDALRLAAALDRHRSYLVVTLDGGISPQVGDHKKYLASAESYPDPHRVLRRHLEHLLGEDAWLDDLVDARVEELLKEEPPPGQVARMAEELARVHRGEETLDEAVDALRRRAETEAPRLLGKCARAEDRARMLAVAVYEGRDWSLVEQEARRLLDHVTRARGTPEALGAAPSPSEPESPPAPPEPVFGDTREQRLERIEARCAPFREERRGSYRYRVEPVCFRVHGLAEALLKHVWREHEAARELLLGWLADAPKDHGLHLVAAHRAGEMARQLSGYQVLKPFREWARSDDSRLRQMAAEALAAAAEDPVLAIQVRERFRRWVRAGWQFRWTAATVCGGSFGASRPQLALEWLGELASYPSEADGQAEVVKAVISSLQQLFTAPTLRRRVLDTLREWIEGGTAVQRKTGLLALASILKPDPRRSRFFRPGDLPGQLQQEGLEELVAGLLWQALNHWYEPFRDVIFDWMNQASGQAMAGLLEKVLAQGESSGTARLVDDLERQGVPDPDLTRVLREARDAWLRDMAAQIGQMEMNHG